MAGDLTHECGGISFSGCNQTRDSPLRAPEHRTTVLSANAIGSKLASHPTLKGVDIIAPFGPVLLVAFVQNAGRKVFLSQG